MSVANYQSALPKVPEQRRSQLLPDGSLITRLQNSALCGEHIGLSVRP